MKSERELKLQEAGATAAIVLVVFCMLVIVSVFKPEPMPPMFAQQPQDTFGVNVGGTEIVRYADRDRRLTVNASAPRDLLVCMRDDCRLVEEWIGK